MVNIPQLYREKLASSVVGTPGVDVSGQMTGEFVARGAEETAAPIWGITEHQQAQRDEAEYNALMVQHKLNLGAAAEDIKVKFASNPDAAGPAMQQAIKDSNSSIVQMTNNPRVKLLAQKGDPFMETWTLKETYQWASQQEYNNIIKGAKTVMDAAGQKLATIGANQGLSVSDMKEQMKPEISILASTVAAIRASKHPELADGFEAAGMKSYYKQLLDNTMEYQPAKAVQLATDPEVTKYFTADEVKKYQNDALSAVKSFPVKMQTRLVQEDLAAHPQLINDVLNGKATYADVDVWQKTHDYGLHDETCKWLKDITMNVAPEGASADRDRLRATFFDDARSIGFKIINGSVKLSEKEGVDKAIASQDIKNLYKFQDEILSATARGIISKEEAKTYTDALYNPLVAKTMQNHDPTFFQKVVNAGTAAIGGIALHGMNVATGGLFHANTPSKVDDFQTASRIIENYINSTGKPVNFADKAAFYDSYFKAMDKAQGQINPATNAKYTPSDIAHAVTGQGLGNYIPTGFGLRKVKGYNDKGPIVEISEEDNKKLLYLKSLEGK